MNEDHTLNRFRRPARERSEGAIHNLGGTLLCSI